MILKQRFGLDRTNYIDIGNDFTYVQPAADEFLKYSYIHKLKDSEIKDCLGFICYERESVPIFKYFPQWIYSNNGKLFMTLTT